MQNFYKQWFLQNIKDKRFKHTVIKEPRVARSYSYFSFSRTQVPFDSEFYAFLKDYTGIKEFTYDYYHIHRWRVSDFFDVHIDKRENRLFGYCCELQESDCKTKLLVKNKPVDEAWFNNETLHNVPKIKNGVRISLTVFGLKPDSGKTLL